LASDSLRHVADGSLPTRIERGDDHITVIGRERRTEVELVVCDKDTESRHLPMLVAAFTSDPNHACMVSSDDR
jgi:hypothetical protein